MQRFCFGYLVQTSWNYSRKKLEVAFLSVFCFDAHMTSLDGGCWSVLVTRECQVAAGSDEDYAARHKSDAGAADTARTHPEDDSGTGDLQRRRQTEA